MCGKCNVGITPSVLMVPHPQTKPEELPAEGATEANTDEGL